MEAKVKWIEKWRVQDPEIGVVKYYSEGFGHEGKWMVENNRWDTGSRGVFFAYNISL